MARFSLVLFLLIGLSRAEGSNSSNCFSMFEAVLEKGYEPYRFVIHGILLAIVVIFGLISNLISIFIFTRPEMRSPLNLILTGIAAFDSLLLIISTLIVVIPAWHIPSFKNIENVRFIAYPLGNVAYIGSLYMILVLSFERYMAVHKNKELTTKRTIILIISVISFAILYSLPTFWLRQLKTLNGKTETKLTKLSCNKTFHMVYNVGMNACFRLIGPTILLIGFNIIIYKEIKKISAQLTKLGIKGMQAKAKEIRISKMIMIIVGIFVFCNCFQFVGLIIVGINKNSFSAYLIFLLAYFMLCLNSSLNVVLYGIYSKKYKRMFLKYFCFKSPLRANDASKSDRKRVSVCQSVQISHQ